MQMHEFMNDYSEWHAFAIGMMVAVLTIWFNPVTWAFAVSLAVLAAERGHRGTGALHDLRKVLHYFLLGLVVPLAAARIGEYILY